MILVSEQRKIWSLASGTLPNNFPSQLYETLEIRIPIVPLPEVSSNYKAKNKQSKILSHLLNLILIQWLLSAFSVQSMDFENRKGKC